MPKVSVIIPNYNHASFLKQRIESVLNQTFQDFELIILDDCSTDNSKEIIESYKNHPKVGTIVYNEINTKNTFKQWSKGFNIAKGELIWIAESDDWCEPTLLENLIKGFDNQNCVLAYCQSLIIRDNQIIWKSETKVLETYNDGKDFIKNQMLEGNNIFNASMVLFRKKIIKKISASYQEFSFCGDWLFWIEIAKFGEVFISGKYLNYFRKHDRDVSGKAYKSGLNFLEEIRILNILLQDRIIDKDRFLNALKVKYKIFKNAKNIFNRQKIISAFFVDKQTKTYLNKNEFLKLKRILKFLKF